MKQKTKKIYATLQFRGFRIWQQYRPLFMVALVAIGWFALSEIAFAQAGGAVPQGGAQTTFAQDTQMKILQIISTILGVLNRLMWPIVMMVGSLFDNEILFGGGMEGATLEMWASIRNIVNIIFAVGLVGIALYNVLGLGGESPYQIKTILPKFVIGLIAVNFSFLAIKVVLDVTNVGTTAVFGLPQSFAMGTVVPEDEKPEESNILQTYCDVTHGPLPAEMLFKFGEEKEGTEKLCVPVTNNQTTKFVPTETLKDMFKTYNPKNASAVMALNLLHMAELDKVVVSPELLSGKSVAMNSILSLILYIIYGSAYIALFILLIVRLVVLWLALVLSPLIILRFVFPNLIEGLGGGEFFTQVVKTAIAPMIVGFVMSVGYILMSTFQKVSFGGSEAISGLSQFSQSTLGINLPLSGLDTFQDLIIAAGTIAFVWVGIKSAMKGTVGESITTGFLDFVKKGTTWLGTAPFKFTRFVPVTVGGKEMKVSPAAIFSTALKIPGALEERRRTKEVEPLLKAIGLGGPDIQDAKKLLKGGGVAQAAAVLKEYPSDLGLLRDDLADNIQHDEANWDSVIRSNGIRFPKHKDQPITTAQELRKALKAMDEKEAQQFLKEARENNFAKWEEIGKGVEIGGAVSGTILDQYDTDILAPSEKQDVEKLKEALRKKKTAEEQQQFLEGKPVYQRLQTAQKAKADFTALSTEVAGRVNNPAATLEQDMINKIAGALNGYASTIQDPSQRNQKIAELLDSTIATHVSDKNALQPYLKSKITGLSPEASAALDAYKPKP